jgi:signal transduction histidine kinase
MNIPLADGSELTRPMHGADTDSLQTTSHPRSPLSDAALGSTAARVDAHLRWLTLGFPKELEEEFRRDYAAKSVWHVRLGIALGIVLWAAFGWLDIWIVPEVREPVWFIRYAIEVPLLALFLLLTFSKRFHRFMHPLGGAVFLLCAFGLIAMVNVVIRPSGVHPYTSGLLLAVPIACVLWRVRFIYAACASLLVVIADNVTAIWVAGLPTAILLTNNFFLVSASLLGLLAGYNMEVYIRREFLQRRAVEKSVGQLNALREVGQSVGSTLDLDAVLTTIVTHAVELSGASGGVIYEFDAGRQAFLLRTSHRVEIELIEALRAAPIPHDEGAIGQAAAALRPVQIPDILDRPDVILPRARPLLARFGYRSLLAVPLLREQTIMGGLVVWRQQSGSFSTETVNLLQTFASQSGLAIYNARLFRELEEKSRQLELANLAKSRFLAAASHDLRQPLHTLSLYSAALKLHVEQGAVGDIAGQINKALGSLSALVDSLLDISKLDAGAVQPQPQAVCMRALIERIEAGYRPVAREKGMEFRVAAADAVVHTDPVLLERLLRNLVDNAFKYTTGGCITLAAARDESMVYITVRDTGPGIPEAERERIFEEFYQIGNPERDRSQGLGLGLAIVRRLAQLLGLAIKLESEPGRGSAFTVTLPLSAEMPAAAPVALAPAAASSRGLAGSQILVIDDEPEVRAGMRTLLERLGCQVAVCGGYAEAEGLLDRHSLKIDLIVADFRLRQHESGIDTVRRLRSRLGNVPALLVTGDTAPERLREAQSSALPLLHKPVSAEKLTEAMRAALQR